MPMYVISIALVILAILTAFLFANVGKPSSVYDQHPDLAGFYGRRMKFIIGIPVLLLVFAVLFLCVDIVPTGYTGVVTTMGQTSDRAYAPGPVFHAPFVSSVYQVNNKQRWTNVEGQIWGESCEDTPVYAEGVDVAYAVNPAASVRICKTIATKDSDLITYSMLTSAIKDAMSTFENSQVTKRGHIEPETVKALQAAVDQTYGPDTLTVHAVKIMQMDFEPSYNEAIAELSNAKKHQEAQAVNNQTDINDAKAKAEVVKTEAQANAEKRRIAAEAEANEILKVAEAQAQANRLLNESLNDNTLKNRFYEKWNGILPNVMGDGAVITNIPTP